MPQNASQVLVGLKPGSPGTPGPLSVDPTNRLVEVNGGSAFKNYTANSAGNQTVLGAVTVDRLIVATAGTTSTCALYDGTDGNGTLIGNFSTLAQGSLMLSVDVATGLFAVLAGGAAAQVTITWHPKT